MVKLISGDCLEKLKNIKTNSIDMVLADPPYGFTACKWDVVIDFAFLWKDLKRVTKDHGAIVMMGCQPFTTFLISSNIGMFKYCWIWDKITGKGHFLAKKRPLRQTEDVIVFGKKPVNYYPIMRPRSRIIKSNECCRSKIIGGSSKGYTQTYTEWYPKNILTFKTERGYHPTQKPVALMEYLISTYTKKSETVLDFCMGSGTTGVACINLDRDFIGIEKNKKYFDLAKKRMEKIFFQTRWDF